MKNSPEALDSSFELEEERISKLESRLINIMQSKEQRGTKERRKMNIVSETRGTPSSPTICVMGVPEGEERERKEQKKIQRNNG